MKAPLNHVKCPQCGKDVDDRVPACPTCGEKIYVNVPGDITPTKHPPLDTSETSDKLEDSNKGIVRETEKASG